MAAIPEITLTVTLQDMTGQPVEGAAVIITLCGYGQTLPRVVGTSMIAKTGPVRTRLATGVSAGIKLWGNDQITPANTYYAITVMDDKQVIIQSGIYQFMGSQTIDLSNATQLETQPPSPTPVPPGNYFGDSIVPTGTINGTNAVFTLPEQPSPAASLKLFKNGVRLTAGVDYAITELTITYVAAQIPQPASDGVQADNHICDYRYSVA